MHIPKGRLLIVAVLLLMVLTAPAQTQQSSEVSSIDAYSGKAKVVRSQGRMLVDLEDLARITKGSLRFEGNRIILILPSDVPTSADNKASTPGFSRPFMAAIEAMA
jgi:hypothetical protein